MSASESEAYEAGMSLAADARRRVAIRLLESVDADEAFDQSLEHWLRTEAGAAYDAVRSDPSRAVPLDDVHDRLEAKWAARP